MFGKDLIIRATGTKAPFRFVLANITDVANIIGKQHGARANTLTLLADAASSSILLSSGLKYAGTVSLQVGFSGDVTFVQADSTPLGLVRAMIPQDEIKAAGDYELLLSPQHLKVRKLGEQGQMIQQSIVEAASQNMSQNLAAYLLQSEQTRSGVGVFSKINANDDSRVDYAIAFIIEAYPDAKAEHLDILDMVIRDLPPIDSFMQPDGFSLHGLLDMLSGPFATEIIREIVPHAYCPCSKERSLASIASFAIQDLQSFIDEGAHLDITCDFCRAHYEISLAEVQQLIDEKNGKKAD